MNRKKQFKRLKSQEKGKMKTNGLKPDIPD